MGDNGATNHRQCHQLRTALAWVLDELGTKRKHVWNPKGKISSEQLRKIERISRAKKRPHFDHFPRPREIIDPYELSWPHCTVSIIFRWVTPSTGAQLLVEKPAMKEFWTIIR